MAKAIKFPIATSILLLAALIFPGMAPAATGVGTVTHLSGPLFARNESAPTRTLAVKSAVDKGDTLVTEKRTYGRVKFTDNGEITLRPGTSFVVDSYFFDKENPKGDSAVFGLVKGSLRAVTGQVGKRGDQNAYRMKTPAATIGVRGTAYDLRVCRDGDCPGLADGIYFFVIEGVIEARNRAGFKLFGVGQYGYVKDEDTEPELLNERPNVNFDLPVFDADVCLCR
ncbi:MAG: FecR domain-containing protein [Geobacteraceae bacterium]|nr:FecR domain-containing protein [Geobacteraceae bacterium]